MRELPVRHTGTIHVQMLVKRGMKSVWEELALPLPSDDTHAAPVVPAAVGAQSCGAGTRGVKATVGNTASSIVEQLFAAASSLA